MFSIINSIFPKSIFIPFIILRIILFPLHIYRKINCTSRRQKFQTNLLIESGVKGWDLIEYKELYASACEYLDSDSVSKLAIDKEKDYLSQIENAIKLHSPTHYVYDPRTSSAKGLSAIFETMKLSFLLYKKEITPIVVLADYSVRLWRCQAGIITVFTGVVVTFLSFRIVHSIFPHNRVIGPSIMPFSYKTFKALSQLISDKPESTVPYAAFAGSLYEPRITILNEIKKRLELKGYEFKIKGRQLGGVRLEDKDYWNELIHADIIVTTSEQIKNASLDLNNVPSLVYRYIETLACGSLLVAPEVPGVKRFFKAGEHYISYSSPQEAVEQIYYFLSNSEKRKSIADNGRIQAECIIKSHAYWTAIDIGLGNNSLT